MSVHQNTNHYALTKICISLPFFCDAISVWQLLQNQCVVSHQCFRPGSGHQKTFMNLCLPWLRPCTCVWDRAWQLGQSIHCGRCCRRSSGTAGSERPLAGGSLGWKLGSSGGWANPWPGT